MSAQKMHKAKTCSGCLYFSLSRDCNFCHRPKELGGNKLGCLPVNGDRCEHWTKHIPAIEVN